MSTATLAVPAGKTAPARSSLRRSRRWALFASYFFLILFAIFFLMPPYYMRSHPKTEGADAITRPRSPITI